MKHILMKGNEALAEAAIRAGCRFYSGYPITPQTEILEYMSWRMEEAGGVFIQTESELSGINMLLGASAGGARVVATSSGPGFTLFQEGISYLVAADLPAVIVDVMRYGNGLGDVGQSQGDYWQLTRGGGHGDYRTIVLAPNSVQENADLAYLAFDLAEKYRHPVLIGSDAAIGQMVEKVELPEMKEHDINKYDWSIKGCKKGNVQKKITNRLYYMENYDEYLRNKYKEMELNEQRWQSIQTEDAEVILVAYGISSRVCIEAVEIARVQGIKLGLIRIITLWPFPVNAFKEVSNDCKAFMTVEMNILGQMVEDVVLATNNKYPVYAYATVKEVPETDIIIRKAKEILVDKEV
ncbi:MULTISPECIES: 3-methyl-2-oxobutanoate dehydrogenase subunit VorB [Clostridium]|uniref:Keto/oxoacid ferredoxin oxidoreductase, beta subunit n=2 Tax=Clostridium TaxID=1485 RepID=A0A0E3K112_CLOSL|nr:MULTISPECIES: 3-methyl-2-oxobutanoate dehydrogenase subunit VorB [Clostridium]AKA69514.1 keto/oxoacid ferredoxin oxidoreductase, beta subunit [Clostridium scatologenes]AWI04392.1 3-methyl-2-oxobutanoate dehydrogenase subunit VorB [Clostridium drakei]